MSITHSHAWHALFDASAGGVPLWLCIVSLVAVAATAYLAGRHNDTF